MKTFVVFHTFKKANFIIWIIMNIKIIKLYFKFIYCLFVILFCELIFAKKKLKY